MRNLIALAATSALVLTAAPAFASDWESTVNTRIDGPLTIGTVSMTPEMQEKAQQVGPDDVQRLMDELREETSESLGKAGLLSDAAGAVTINLYLADAEPNRPTHWQLSGKGAFGDRDDARSRFASTSLSLRSIALGGAEVTAEFISASGENLGSITYDYDDARLEDVQGYTTWTAANRGIDRFARKLPAKLTPTS